MHVDVKWVGLECRQKEESEDEIMGHVIMINRATGEHLEHKFPGDRGTWTMGGRGERIVTVGVPLYSGPPVPIVLRTDLVEHDSDDEDIELYKRRTREAVANVVNASIASGTGLALPGVDELVSDLSRALVNAFSDLIGAGDDAFNQSSVALDVNVLSDPNRPRLTAEREDDPKVISYTPLDHVHEFITVTGRDDGGSVGEYRFYFDVNVSGADEPGTPPGPGERTPTTPTETGTGPGTPFVGGAGDPIIPPHEEVLPP